MTLRSTSPHFPTIAFPRPVRVALALLLLALGTGAAQATTYYVRTDGGSAAQCTGKSNAAYPGSGSNQACAWNSLHQALPAGGTARIAGGDTVYIAPGDYMLGWGAPGASGGRCYDGGRYDCYLPPVPSGPSATSRTRILGTSASNKARLWGTERVQYMLNLIGSSNVEIGNLEITDQSDCVEFHSDASARCKRDSTPYGQWAGVGIMASNSKNVYLHDLDIHGMANRGIVAGGLTDWTVENVKIVANGWAGWDGDIGSGSSNSGNIILRGVEIAWNGCGEKWQSRSPWACWAQTASGYGDGLGTAKTGGHWLIEDSYIHHNTSDGLDLLYMDGGSNSSVTVRRTHAVGNAGNQLKTLGKTLIENSVVVGNCAYFNGRDSMKSDDQCRALGNAISVGLVSGQDITIRHNTITGQGDCLILSEGGSSTSSLNIQNNALIGQVDWRSDLQGNTGELTCGHYAYNSSARLTYSGNLFYNVKQGQCPSGSTCSNPKLASIAIASFDATPQSGSPLIDKAPYLAAVTDDFYGNARPSGGAADIGAIELQAGGGDPTPQPTCSRAQPVLTLSGASQAAAGASVTYTATLANKDSDACASTRFSLARTLPSGWSGSFAASSLLIDPGKSASTTLTISSATSAPAGTYTVAAASGSSNGSVHTASATASLRIEDAPVATCSRKAPTLTLASPTGAVAPGGGLQLAATLRNNDTSGCASTPFSLARTVPAGWSGTLSRSSVTLAPGATATAMLSIQVPASASSGSHAVAVGTSSNASAIHAGSASANVLVARATPPGFRLDVRADFNGDGRSDVLWRHGEVGWNAIWKQASSSDPEYLAQVSNVDWRVVGIADFDGDGEDDILWRNGASGANTIWLSGDSQSRSALTAVTNLDWEVAAVGDFNADGRADVFWRNARDGRNVVWPSASYAGRFNARRIADGNWRVVGTSDFNADGKTDLVWRNARSGGNTIWLGANANQQKRLTTVTNLAWNIVGVDDFDGDNVPDLLWRHAANGQNVIWHGGEYTAQQRITTVPDRNWQVATTGDYDGDGRADIFWRHATNGQDVIWNDADYARMRRVDTVSPAWLIARP